MAVLTAAQVRESRTARLRRRIADNLLAYAFLAAGILCFAFFSWYPLVKGVVLSFQQDNFVIPPYWVGLENYRALFADPLFWTAWKNTVMFTGLALVFGYAVPFVLAVLLNEFRHLKGVFRVAGLPAGDAAADRQRAALAVLLRPGQRPVQHDPAAGCTCRPSQWTQSSEHRDDLAGPACPPGPTWAARR